MRARLAKRLRALADRLDASDPQVVVTYQIDAPGIQQMLLELKRSRGRDLGLS